MGEGMGTSMTHALLFSMILTAAIPFRHDFKYPSPSFQNTLYAIIMQESSGCQFVTSHRSTAAGCGQMLVSTAHQVDGCGCVTRDMLINRPRLAIKLAARELHACAVHFHHSWALATSCYHIGAPVTEQTRDDPAYLLAVWEKLP